MWFTEIKASGINHAEMPMPRSDCAKVDLFERRFSADGAKHHKPSRQAYAYVEKELGVEPSRLCLIACHTWDTLGAAAAGWGAALTRISHSKKCIGAPNQRKFFCDKDFPQIRGRPDANRL